MVPQEPDQITAPVDYYISLSVEPLLPCYINNVVFYDLKKVNHGVIATTSRKHSNISGNKVVVPS